MERVRVGTCSIANAAAVRALLDAHGIAATTVGGGPYAAFAVDVWVAACDADEAAALLAELSETPDADAEDDDDDAADAIDTRVQRTRQVGLAILLACCVTFGSGHALARAWLRALALAAIEIYGIALALREQRVGLAVVAGAIVADAIGATLQLRRRFARVPLPRARVRT
jgi:hypothetical protein